MGLPSIQSGIYNSIGRISNSEMALTQYPTQVLNLCNKVQSGELSVFEAHEMENNLMAQKSSTELTYQVSQIEYENELKLRKEATKRDWTLNI